MNETVLIKNNELNKGDEISSTTSIIGVSVVAYEGNKLIDCVSFIENDNIDEINNTFNLVWSDEFNNKDKYVIVLRDTFTGYTKRSSLIISERFKNTVIINNSFIEFQISSLYKKDWFSYSTIER